MMEVFQFFGTLRWQDVIDIALSSYILFRFYILFRGTYVFRVVSGLVLLWLFQRLAVTVGLIVTSWAIQTITAVAAFIVIVVFRNEIRNVLQAKNLRAILWGLSQKAPETPIDIVTAAVFELMRKRIGALLVFPGKADLEDVVHKGIPWQGKVSREMLISIFFRDNPVHDGAAIVSGDRITEVSTLLPLTQRDDLPSQYGTRHRAAAGLAERTDALVVVVSEERESVVAAKGTDLIEIRTAEQFINLLQEHAGQAGQTREETVPERVRLGAAAMISVILVTGMWFSFTRGRDTLINLDVPVEYMNRDAEMEIVEASVNSVSLQLSGSGTLIKTIRPEQVQVRIDLSGAGIGKNNFTITRGDVSLPPGVDLRMIRPQELDVVLDVVGRKRIPIQVDWVGTLDPALRLESVRLEPPSVEVEGSMMALDQISTVYTQPAPLDGLKETGTLNLGLALSSGSLNLAPGSKDRVSVEHVIRKR